MKRKPQKLLFYFFILSSLPACVPSTPHDQILISKLGVSSTDASYCNSAHSNASPFANSSDSPTGTSASDPYRICTAVQYNKIGSSSSYWNKYFILMTDINLSSYDVNTLNRIGNSTTAFTGTFLGNGKQIIGTTLTAATTDYFALFPYIDAGAVIKDLILISFTITGQNYVGALIGKMSGGSVSNVSLLDSSVNGVGYVGGLIGLMVDGSVNRSSFIVSGTSNTAKVVGSASRIGGLIGKAQAGAINYCSTSLPGVSGVSYVGGLVGYNDGAAIYGSTSQTNSSAGILGTTMDIGGLVGHNRGVISSSSSAHQNVTGVTNVGGLVGYNEVDIEKSYSTITTTTGVVGTNYVGGLIGYNLSGIISRSYAIVSKVYAGASYVGGLIGYLADGEVNISYAKVNSTVQGVASYVGGLIGYSALGTISNSYSQLYGSNGSLVGASYIGGLIGTNAGADVNNATVTATSAFGNYSYLGGLIGSMSGGNVRSCILNIVGIGTNAATGTIIGSVIGQMSGGNILSCTSAVSGSIYGGTYVGGVVGYISAAAVRVEAVILSVAGSLNTINATNAFLGGAVGYNAGDVHNLAVTISAGVIGAGDNVGGLIGYNDPTGVFTHSTLSSTSITGEDNVGGAIGFSAGKAQSITISLSGSVSGENNYIGGVVGLLEDGQMLKIIATITGSIVNTVAAGSGIGGFVGAIVDAGADLDVEIVASTVAIGGNVVGLTTTDYVGGFVGQSTDLLLITNSSTTITGNVSGDQYVGGFVGSSSTGTIAKSKSIIGGNINGINASSYSGGFAGYVAGTNVIEDSYSRVTGYVASNSGADDYAGGFAGGIVSPAKVHNVYGIASSVKGKNYVGSLVGSFESGAFAELSHSFAVANVLGVAGQTAVEYLLGTHNSDALPSTSGAVSLYYSSTATCAPYLAATSCVPYSTIAFTPTALKNPSASPATLVTTDLYLTWDFTNVWYNNSATSDYPTLR